MVLVRSAGSGRRFKSTVKVIGQPAPAAAESQERATVATWRFQVAGARPPQAVVTATVTASTLSVDSGRSSPSSRSSRVMVWS